jgi:hypothetical protein
MDDGLLERILRESGEPGLLDALARLSPTDLQSLLLAVFAQRAQGLSPADVLRRYQEDAFVQPADVDPRALARLDAKAFSLLPVGYEPLELAPVAPLGTTSVLGGLSQNVAVATVRNGEVVSDSTNVLALEAASRRRGSREPVLLAAGHRLLRGQRYPSPWRQHFRLFALVAAGRGAEFEREALLEQIGFHLRLLAPLPLRLALTDLDGTVGAGAADELAQRFPEVDVRLAPEREQGRGYYERICFHVHVGDLQLADGGFTDWTQRLLSDRKERLLVSGLGSELAVRAGET